MLLSNTPNAFPSPVNVRCLCITEKLTGMSCFHRLQKESSETNSEASEAEASNTSTGDTSGGSTTGGGSGVSRGGAVGNSWLSSGIVAGTGGVGGDWAVLSNADGLELRALGWDDSGGRSASVTEGAHEGHADSLDIGISNTERSSGHANLGDKVSHLRSGEIHELVDVVLGGASVVGWVAFHSLHGAAKESTEVLVQVCQEGADDC